MVFHAGCICASVWPPDIGISPITLRKPRIRPPLISAGSSGKKISAKWEMVRSVQVMFWRAATLACSLSASLTPVLAISA